MRTLHEHRATVYTHTVSSRSFTQRAAVRDSPGQTGKRSTVVTLTKAFDLCVADCTISHCTCLSSSLRKPCFFFVDFLLSNITDHSQRLMPFHFKVKKTPDWVFCPCHMQHCQMPALLSSSVSELLHFLGPKVLADVARFM